MGIKGNLYLDNRVSHHIYKIHIVSRVKLLFFLLDQHLTRQKQAHDLTKPRSKQSSQNVLVFFSYQDLQHLTSKTGKLVNSWHNDKYKQ